MGDLSTGSPRLPGNMETRSDRHVPRYAVKLPIVIVAAAAALIWWIFA